MSVGYKTYGFCNGFTEERRGKKLRRVMCYEPMPDEIGHDDSTQVVGLQNNMRRLAGGKGWTRDGDRDYCPECSKRRRDAAE